MKVFELFSSRKILVNEGIVNEYVLSELIKEAYNHKKIYAECRIIITKKNHLPCSRNKNVPVTYKELWDCYRNLTGRTDYHPYDKEHPFSLGKAFIETKKNERLANLIGFLDNLSIGDIKFTKIQEPLEERVVEEIKKIPLKRGRKKKREVSLIENYQNI